MQNRIKTLKKRADFIILRCKRKKIFGKDILINYYTANNDQETRIGITVSKKHGNAVRRNYIKRVFKAIFIKNNDILPVGYDLEFIPKKSENKINFLDLENDILNSLKKLNSSVNQ
mgnify:CR=1 FL=1|tara:strand:+ start:2828 stop:3175 length:348 start_codon:yes stop_codon:yes gene_type:complete